MIEDDKRLEYIKIFTDYFSEMMYESQDKSFLVKIKKIY